MYNTEVNVTELSCENGRWGKLADDGSSCKRCDDGDGLTGPVTTIGFSHSDISYVKYLRNAL